jgi:hypothetical protein
VQHLDDVLGLEDLRLEPVQRERRPVAPAVEGETHAGVAQELPDVLLHPALWQGEVDGAVAAAVVDVGHGGIRTRKGAMADGTRPSWPARVGRGYREGGIGGKAGPPR